jgi:3-oxoacyl-[acyl-carrier protein] reductase
MTTTVPATTALTGRTVLVTGGTRGIGRAVVLGLAAAGANVVTCYRNDGEHVESLSRELKATAGEHRVIRADVTDPEAVDRLLSEVESGYGRLHAVVSNAGVISHVPFAELPLEEWHRVIDSHLTGTFLVVQRSLRLLDEGASIVMVGSRVATVGLPLRSHYTAAKAGLVGLARSLSKELGKRGIRVNVIEPGVIETEEAAKLPPEKYAALQQRYRELTAIGRLGTPAEVADVALFLVGDLSRYVTGASIAVDGGI